MTRKSDQEPRKYHTETFEKISDEKKERIIDAAITEFAQKGYNATSINVVARKAQISIGSMYSYFPSKETLILTILDYGRSILAEVLNEILETETNFFEKVEALIRASVEHAVKHRELYQIYLDASTEGLRHLAHEMSMTMETITANFYLKYLTEAQENGLVRKDLDPRYAAFCIDNLMMMVQFSHSSAYYRERMKLYIGTDGEASADELIKGLMDFITRGIQA